jgi:nucleolar GTP-binding protein
MLAKVAGQKRKRAREEEEAMDVDMDGDEGEDDEDGWMDVDGEEAPKLKKVRGNSGAVVAVSGKREPRSNRQLMGMRDQGVSLLILLSWCRLRRISFTASR